MTPSLHFSASRDRVDQAPICLLQLSAPVVQSGSLIPLTLTGQKSSGLGMCRAARKLERALRGSQREASERAVLAIGSMWWTDRMDHMKETVQGQGLHGIPTGEGDNNDGAGCC